MNLSIGYTDDTLDSGKLVIPLRNIWHMLLYAWDEVPVSLSTLTQGEESAPDLDSLLCMILVRLIQQRFRIGLGRNYLSQNNIVRGIRGKINFTPTLKKGLLYKGQTQCSFQEYSINVPKNQIVRTTLQRMVRVGKFGNDRQFRSELIQSMLSSSMTMEGVDLVQLSLDFFDRQQLGRNDRDYRLMLAICRLLFLREMPLGSGSNSLLPKVNPYDLVMTKIYEDFVANFYKHHLTGWRITPQKVFEWHQRNEDQFLPKMQPDLLLENPETGRTFILDTKFTSQTSTTQYGSEKYKSSHLYQIYTYMKTQDCHPDQKRVDTGILLYPKTSQSALNTTIELHGQDIRISCIDLSEPWQQIERNLLNLVSEI